MAKTTLKSLSDALAVRLVEGALPGELKGFGKADRAEAARFVAAAAAERQPGTVKLSLETISADDTDRRMRLAIINDDMPFLVDSIAAAIAAHDIAIERILHPIVPVTRGADGALTQIGDGTRESMIYIEMERADARTRRALAGEIESALANVRSAVSDWEALQLAMAADAAWLRDSGRDLDGEGAALLDWFLDRNFTLLGHEKWRRTGKSSERLGIARHNQSVPLLAEASRALAADWFAAGNAAPLLVKSNLASLVHRRVPLDLILLPLTEGGELVGLSIHAGLWTSAALNALPESVPVLRARLAALEARFGFAPASHAGKALTHALTALPHDLMIGFAPAALEELALAAMSLADRPRPELVLVE